MPKTDSVTLLLPGQGPQGEIDWVNVSEHELRERASVFSYDLWAARKKVRVQPIWVRFITAHIYVDHILTCFIRDNMPNAGALVRSGGRRKYLIDKLEICEAMAWIPRDLAAVVKRLNTMRNGFAHDLNFVVQKAEVESFLAIFPTTMKELANYGLDARKSASGPRDNEVSIYLETFLVVLDMQRQRVLATHYLARHRERELGRAMINAKKVLEKLDDPSGR